MSNGRNGGGYRVCTRCIERWRTASPLSVAGWRRSDGGLRVSIDAEMSNRGLEAPAGRAWRRSVFQRGVYGGASRPSVIELITFNVPMDAETAMRLLDGYRHVPAHMEHAVRQVNEDGPKVKMNWLSIFVERPERRRDGWHCAKAWVFPGDGRTRSLMTTWPRARSRCSWSATFRTKPMSRSHGRP